MLLHKCATIALRNHPGMMYAVPKLAAFFRAEYGPPGSGTAGIGALRALLLDVADL
jgi:hypothetical protein